MQPIARLLKRAHLPPPGWERIETSPSAASTTFLAHLAPFRGGRGLNLPWLSRPCTHREEHLPPFGASPEQECRGRAGTALRSFYFGGQGSPGLTKDPVFSTS